MKYDKELYSISILGYVAGFSMNLSEDLKGNTYFKQNIKKFGNRFLKELNFLDNKVNALPVPDKKKLTISDKIKSDSEFYDELQKSYIHIERLITFEMNLTENKRDYFMSDLDDLMNKFSK